MVKWPIPLQIKFQFFYCKVQNILFWLFLINFFFKKNTVSIASMLLNFYIWLQSLKCFTLTDILWHKTLRY